MSFLVNPYQFGVPVSELARDTSFYTDGSNLTAYTSDARGIGTASSTRRVYALIFGYSLNAGRTLSSSTIGGISATIDKQVTGSDGSVVCAIVSATVPTGTTAVVAPTFSSGMNGCAIAVIALDSLQSTTPVDTKSNSAQTNAISSGAISINQGGYCMAIAGNAVEEDLSTASVAWTNAIEGIDFDFNMGDSGAHSQPSIAYISPGAAASPDITATFTNTNASLTKAICAVSVR